jgi:hypothetical protein
MDQPVILETWIAFDENGMHDAGPSRELAIDRLTDDFGCGKTVEAVKVTLTIPVRQDREAAVILPADRPKPVTAK